MHSPKRRRAIVACNYCRKRKRKCDGGRPACSLCEEVGHSCEYREVEPPRNASVPLDQLNGILDRLEALERRADGLITVDQTDPSRQHPDGADFILGKDFGLGSAETTDVAPSLAPTPLNSAGLNTTMAIPLSHSTTTGSLLRSAPG